MRERRSTAANARQSNIFCTRYQSSAGSPGSGALGLFRLGRIRLRRWGCLDRWCCAAGAVGCNVSDVAGGVEEKSVRMRARMASNSRRRSFSASASKSILRHFELDTERGEVADKCAERAARKRLQNFSSPSAVSREIFRLVVAVGHADRAVGDGIEDGRGELSGSLVREDQSDLLAAALIEKHRDSGVLWR